MIDTHIHAHAHPPPQQLRAQCAAEGVDDRELARRLVDLVVVSVLLDAGAGDKWRYREEGTGQTIGRSEGLGVRAVNWYVFLDACPGGRHRACLPRVCRRTVDALAD